MNYETVPYRVFHLNNVNGETCGWTHTELAKIISTWTIGEHMLPKSQEDITGLFEKGLSVVVFNSTKPVGHAAIALEYPDTKQIEIGTIIVKPDMRGKHVGTVATHAVLQVAKHLYPGWLPMAMANPASAKLFTKYGGTEMPTKTLSPMVFEYCVTCPKRPIQPDDGSPKCCDTPYDLSPIDVTLGVSWLSLYVWGGIYEK